MIPPFRGAGEVGMDPVIQLAFYSAGIFTASMAGGWAPSAMRFTHKQLHLLMSLVAGLMLGVGVFILLPHAAEQLHSLDDALLWLMVGLLGMFFLIRAFHFHQHASIDPDEGEPASNAGEQQLPVVSCGHDHDHGHHDHTPAHRLSWTGIGFGLTVHTLIDGMALAASVQAESSRDAGQNWFVGVGTFLAIFLHKPLDAMSITTLMASGGWSQRARFFVNAAFASICPIGVMLFFLAGRVLTTDGMLLGVCLAFSAGVFLCISLGDLLPEIQFHDHDRVALSAALLTGVVVAWGIHFLEPTHVHGSHEAGKPATHLREPGHPY